MDRRLFLGSLAAASAQAEPRLRIAFLGAGHPHAFEKCRILRESPDFELAGIWEDDPKVRARYESLGVPFLERDRILSDNALRVVAVESDNRDHAAHARLALAAGKHVHLEKPPADSLTAFRALAELASSRRLLLQMGYMWRYNPAIERALEAARNGWLGDVYMVRGAIDTLAPPQERPALAAFRGGQMFELGCHLIDPIVRLLGRPASIRPFLRTDGDAGDKLADNTAAVLEFSRAIAIVSSAALHPSAFRHRFFEILGTNGTAIIRPIEPPALQIDLGKPAGPYVAGLQRVALPPFRRYVADFGELAAAIRSKRPLAVPAEDEVVVQETLLRACEMVD